MPSFCRNCNAIGHQGTACPRLFIKSNQEVQAKTGSSTQTGTGTKTNTVVVGDEMDIDNIPENQKWQEVKHRQKRATPVKEKGERSGKIGPSVVKSSSNKNLETYKQNDQEKLAQNTKAQNTKTQNTGMPIRNWVSPIRERYNNQNQTNTYSPIKPLTKTLQSQPSSTIDPPNLLPKKDPTQTRTSSLTSPNLIQTNTPTQNPKPPKKTAIATETIPNHTEKDTENQTTNKIYQPNVFQLGKLPFHMGIELGGGSNAKLPGRSPANGPILHPKPKL